MTIPRILYLSNQFEARKRMVLLLTQADCEVLPASTMKQGLDFLRIVKPDLILCKMVLPDGEADTLIQTLKTSKEFEAIPIVVLSLEPDQQREAKILKLGASTVLHLNDPDDFVVTTIKEIAELNLSSSAEDSVSITGQLARMDIVELIREMAKEHGSGLISIDGSERMEIHLDQGNVVFARHGITIGKKALFRCLRIAEAAYHFTPQSFEGEPNVSGDLDALIEEARESNQKLMANSHRFPIAHHRLKINFTEELKRTKLRPEARAALEVIKRYPMVKEYLTHLNLPDTDCYEYLLSFKERGFIDITENQRPICILTDSSCDLGIGVLKWNQIEMIPMKLRVDDQTEIADSPNQLDQVLQLSPRQLSQATALPVSENAFLTRTMARVATEDCLCLLPSTHLVPTHQNEISDLRKLIRIGIDGRPLMVNELVYLETNTFSLGLGLLALKAAQFRQEGMLIEAIRDQLLSLQERLYVLVAVEEGSSALAPKGNARQVLSWHHGAFHAIAKLPRDDATHACFLEHIDDRIDSDAKLQIAIGQVKNQWEAGKLGDFLEESKPLAQITTYPLGPVTSYLLGNKALAVAFLQG